MVEDLTQNAGKGNGMVVGASDLSPFLNMGVTLALHQSARGLAVSKDRSKITFNP